MKKILFFAAAAAFLAACSSDDLSVQEQPQAQVQAEPGAVGFDAYIYRATTRAGMQGPTTLPALKGTDPKYEPGFAVFAYYTNNNEYDGQTLPNFMYNQNVKWNGSIWSYTPIMYWPNEYGQNAISDDNDKVTFFAYAPYVEVVPSTGKLANVSDGKDQWGIVQVSRNTTTGDPWVKYIASFDGAKQVDLCWGVNSTPSWNTVNAGVQTFTAELPWLNVERPREAETQADATAASKVKFQFKHALSQLNVTVDTYTDGDALQAVEDGSRVFVRSITFTGFTMKGMLNLNNTEAGKPLWIDFNGNGDLEAGQEIVVTDGRRDGKEGTAGGALPNEKGVGLNPEIVETEQAYNYATPTAWKTGDYATDADKNVPYGVDAEKRNVFRKWQDSPAKYIAMGATDPIYVIPTGEDVQVTIVYDVETIDSQLPVYLADAKTTGSNIENKITKTVNFGESGMEAGKKYTINLHLGMNSVKIDAAVDGWTEPTEMDVDLPSNKPQFAAAKGASYDYTLDGATTSLVFDMYGFNGGEALAYSNTAGSPNIGSITVPNVVIQANAQGKATSTLTIPANTTVKNHSGKVTWTGTSEKQVELNLTQKAKPLGLTTEGMSTTATVITLKAGTAEDKWSSVADETKDVIVYRNGVKLQSLASGSAAAAGKIVFDKTAGTLTVASTETITTSDVFTITIKSGDAPAETITYKPTSIGS